MTEATTFPLSIDVGTGGTRALVINQRGQVVSSATEAHEPFASPQIGWAEQHAADWWRACGTAVSEALGQAKLRGSQIACVGFSGQMHGAVMLDQHDQVVRPALIWCDQRTEPQSRELTEKIGADRIIHLTCNPALTNFTLTKFLWVRENEPHHWSQVRAVMLSKDYVRFRLTGERATDIADASGTLLLDVAHRRWSPEVLAAAVIDQKFLPPLYESPEACGKISGEGAATGLQVGTPVVAAGVVEIPRLQHLLHYICENGFEHHVAANFSTVAGAIHEAATRYLGWQMYWHRN